MTSARLQSQFNQIRSWLQAAPTPNPAKPSRLQIGLWLALTALTLGLIFANFDSIQVGINRDDAEYVILTRSLVQANQYGQMNAPGEPAPTRFPFGFPLLLTPFQLLWPNNFEALKGLPVLATLINIALIFWGWPWFSRQTSHWWGLAVAALYATAPLTIGHTHVIMSEPVFLTESLLALILIEKLRRTVTTGPWAFILGALFALLIFTRTLGVLLLVAACMYLLVIKGRNSVLPIAQIFAGLVAALGLIIALTPVRLTDLIPAEYLQQLTAPAAWGQTQIEAPLVQRFFSGLRDYGEQHFRALIFPLGTGTAFTSLADRLHLPFLPALLGWAFTAVLVLGALLLFVRERLSAFWLYAFLYVWPLTVWPWRDPRFLYPIYPQILFAYLLGGYFLVSFLVNRLPKISARLIAPALVGALLLVAIYKSLTLEPSLPHVGDFSTRTAWLRTHTAPTDIFYTEEAVIDYIYGQRPNLAKPYGDFTQFETYLAANHAAYVLIAPEIVWQTTYTAHYSARAQQTLQWMQDLVQHNQAQLVYEEPGQNVKVFKLALNSGN